MRKFFVCVILFLSVSAVCFGQADSTAKHKSTAQKKPYGPGRFNFGIDGSEVIGAYNDTYSTGLGYSLKYEIPVNKNLYGTLSTGYEAIFTKSSAVSAAVGYKGSYGFFPQKIGLKYCYKAHYFIEGQAGALIPAEKTNTGDPNLPEPIVETTFLYSIGIGYTMPRGVEVGLRFESWDEGAPFNQAALRVAYRF